MCGRVSAVAAGAGFASLAYNPTPAFAICGSTHSVRCDGLDNWNTNSCPPDSCGNTTVFWDECDTKCSSTLRTRYYDCCSACKSSNTHCKPCHCDNSGPPSCCFCTSNSTVWCSGGCTADQNCVCCRRYACVGGNPIC